MAITVLPRESSAVRCAICARPARRGTTLCAQCKAAVKRARQVQSVRSEFLPHPVASIDALPPFVEPATPRTRSNGVAASAGPGGWGTYATLVAFGAAVCLTGYLALGELEDASSALHDAASTSRPAPAKRRSDGDQGPRSSVATVEPDAAAHAEATGATAKAEPAARGPAERRLAREARQAGQPAASSAAFAGAEPLPPPDEASAPAAAPPPVEVREAPEPAPDREQLLAVALSRCERENALVGLFCKERARLQYCDGQWGSAPQCPLGVASNNTR